MVGKLGRKKNVQICFLYGRERHRLDQVGTDKARWSAGVINADAEKNHFCPEERGTEKDRGRHRQTRWSAGVINADTEKPSYLFFARKRETQTRLGGQQAPQT